MRSAIAAAALGLVLGCNSNGEDPPAAVIPEWSCTAGASCSTGTVSCPNADRVRTIYDALGWYVVCEWDCGMYAGKKGRVVATLWPACRVTETGYSCGACRAGLFELDGLCGGPSSGFATIEVPGGCR